MPISANGSGCDSNKSDTEDSSSDDEPVARRVHREATQDEGSGYEEDDDDDGDESMDAEESAWSLSGQTEIESGDQLAGLVEAEVRDLISKGCKCPSQNHYEDLSRSDLCHLVLTIRQLDKASLKQYKNVDTIIYCTWSSLSEIFVHFPCLDDLQTFSAGAVYSVDSKSAKK